MHDRLKKHCEAALENFVAGLFADAAALPGADNFFTAPSLQVPVIGGITFIAGWDPPCLRQRVIRAIMTREKFRRAMPTWPELPLYDADCEAMRNADNVRLNVLGYYRGSLHGEGWDHRHPRFVRFVGALLASERTPDEIRNDVDLRRQFPPCEVDGFDDESLVWRIPEIRAALRKNAENYAAANPTAGQP